MGPRPRPAERPDACVRRVQLLPLALHLGILRCFHHHRSGSQPARERHRVVACAHGCEGSRRVYRRARPALQRYGLQGRPVAAGSSRHRCGRHPGHDSRHRRRAVVRRGIRQGQHVAAVPYRQEDGQELPLRRRAVPEPHRRHRGGHRQAVRVGRGYERAGALRCGGREARA